MNIDITHITTVRENHGSDYTYLHTELPSGIWPFSGTTQLKLTLARGTAEQYCSVHFPGIEHKILDV